MEPLKWKTGIKETGKQHLIQISNSFQGSSCSTGLERRDQTVSKVEQSQWSQNNGQDR